MEWRYSSRDRVSGGAAREDLETDEKSEIEIGKGRYRDAYALCRIEEGNHAGLQRCPMK